MMKLKKDTSNKWRYPESNTKRVVITMITHDSSSKWYAEVFINIQI